MTYSRVPKRKKIQKLNQKTFASLRKREMAQINKIINYKGDYFITLILKPDKAIIRQRTLQANIPYEHDVKLSKKY